MKKWLLILGITLMLTGCQSIEELENAAYKEYKLTSYTDQYFTQDLVTWASLQLACEGDNNVYRNRNRNWYDDRITGLGAKRLDGGIENLVVNDGQFIEEVIINQDGTTEKSEYPNMSKHLIETLSTNLGEPFDSFLEEMKKVEGYCIKEKTIDGTGIVFLKSEGQLSMWVVQSSIQMKNEEDNNWLKAICGEDLIVSTATAGEEKQLIELSYPSFVVRNDMGSLTNATAYYQLFRTNEGQLEKARMVINQYINGYKDADLNPDKVDPLRRIVNELAGEETDVTELINDIYKVVDQKSSKESGKIGKLNYEINRRNAEIGIEKLVEVVVTSKPQKN